eukprot:2347787-Lingulodinium_polyedra.AAC.1
MQTAFSLLLRLLQNTCKLCRNCIRRDVQLLLNGCNPAINMLETAPTTARRASPLLLGWRSSAARR